MKYVIAFLRFWYDFIVGDDWRIAAGIVGALGVTFGLAHSGVPAWWITPLALAALLTVSLWRAARNRP